MTDDRHPQTEPFEPHGSEVTQSDDPVHRLLGAQAEFGANLSRDVRAPLTLLLGPLQDILDSPASALAPDSRHALEAARRKAVKVLQLLDVLPDLHFAEDNAASVRRAESDLASFTADLVDHFRAPCDAAGLRLLADCPPLPAHVAVDREAWEKIVINLVAYAFHSTIEGTIEVRVRAREAHAELTVSDTGAGISEAELPYVFDRVDGGGSSPATRSLGTCVGLPFVRDLVRLHNGSIDVHSTPGSGTTFIVRLPLEAGATVAAAGEAQRLPPAPVDRLPADVDAVTADPAAAARGRVVIAEDHDETRDYLCVVLRAAGFSVEAVADGRAALERCQLRPPDALVSDVAMPGLDGLDLIGRLRGGERTAVVPVLLLSAHGGEDSRIEGILAGADDYLVKPLSRRELVARVDGAVQLGRLRREMTRREEADLDALFSLAPDGVIVVGQNDAILAANERARNLFRYTMQELVRLQVAALIPEIDRPEPIVDRQVHEDASGARLRRPLRELRAVRSDGTEFSAEIAAGPLRFKNQPCTIAIVRDITERKKLEAERAEQERRFLELSRRLVEVQEAERRQLSTELHDRTSPQLAAIQINLKLLAESLRGRDTEDVRALLDDTVHLIHDTTVGIREISSNLRPSVLDDGGLLPAVQAYAHQLTQRTGIVVHLHAPDARANALPPAVQSNLFRIVQEALTNCVKHAKASNIVIRLATGDSHVISLTIADDGVGFDFEVQSKRGLGLLTMRERAEFMGGRFTIDTRPGSGTRIQVLV